MSLFFSPCRRRRCIIGRAFPDRVTGWTIAAPTEGGPPALRLGDFEIVRELGRGGMGIVYEARQVALNRQVALKVLATGLGLTARAVNRLQREAEAAGFLRNELSWRRSRVGAASRAAPGAWPAAARYRAVRREKYETNSEPRPRYGPPAASVAAGRGEERRCPAAGSAARPEFPNERDAPARRSALAPRQWGPPLGEKY